jgi:hypothetical protein
METTIPKKTKAPHQIEKVEKIIYNPRIIIKETTHIDVLRISDEEEFTRIDFIYTAPKRYTNGGWVQMHPDCFIRPCGSSTQLKLVKAVNIPIAPSKYFFKKINEVLCYTLYFPALPTGTTSIDIIESESFDENWFNFYGVSLEQIKSDRIQVNNN